MNSQMVVMIRASGGGKPWASTVRSVPYSRESQTAARDTLALQGHSSAGRDMVIVDCGPSGPLLIVRGKYNLGPLALATVVGASIETDETGQLFVKKFVSIENMSDRCLLIGSMDIVLSLIHI